MHTRLVKGNNNNNKYKRHKKLLTLKLYNFIRFLKTAKKINEIPLIFATCKFILILCC